MTHSDDSYFGSYSSKNDRVVDLNRIKRSLDAIKHELVKANKEDCLILLISIISNLSDIQDRRSLD